MKVYFIGMVLQIPNVQMVCNLLDTLLGLFLSMCRCTRTITHPFLVGLEELSHFCPLYLASAFKVAWEAPDKSWTDIAFDAFPTTARPLVQEFIFQLVVKLRPADVAAQAIREGVPDRSSKCILGILLLALETYFR